MSDDVTERGTHVGLVETSVCQVRVFLQCMELLLLFFVRGGDGVHSCGLSLTSRHSFYSGDVLTRARQFTGGAWCGKDPVPTGEERHGVEMRSDS